MKQCLFYTTTDIQEIMGIGRSNAYDFVKAAYTEQKPFKVVKIGKLYRISKSSFDAWLMTL